MDDAAQTNVYRRVHIINKPLGDLNTRQLNPVCITRFLNDEVDQRALYFFLFSFSF
jgi:hypothetical protein